MLLFFVCFHMASLDFIPEHTMWVGMKKATAAIVDDGETGTSASLRGHSVCYWWAADVYGYSKRLTWLLWHCLWHRRQVLWRQRPREWMHNDAVSIHVYELGCIYFLHINVSAYFFCWTDLQCRFVNLILCVWLQLVNYLLSLKVTSFLLGRVKRKPVKSC